MFGRTSSSGSKTSPVKSTAESSSYGSNLLTVAPSGSASASVMRPKERTVLFKRNVGNEPVDDTMSIDWVSDKSAKECILCDKKFNTFKRRRHHCRQCGRVVCWSCSTKRLVLQAAHFQNVPQRVCDGCYVTLTEKRHAKVHAISVREKEEQLLMTTSYVSDCLIRVFFLDGSFVTVSYDDCSTAADVIDRVCLNVRCALFEVDQDMRDRDQYTLLLESDTIVDIITRWSLATRSAAKLVIPLYDQSASHTGRGGNVQSWRAHGSLISGSRKTEAGPEVLPSGEWHDTWDDDTSSIGTTSGAFSSAMEDSGILPSGQVSSSYNSNVGKGTPPPLQGSATKPVRRYENQPSPLRVDTSAGFGYDLAEEDLRRPDLQRSGSGGSSVAELHTAKEQLANLQKKYDLLKNIHSRLTLQRSAFSANAEIHAPQLSSGNKFRGESYDLFDEKSTVSGRSDVHNAMDNDSISESSYFPNDSGDDESVYDDRRSEYVDRGSKTQQTEPKPKSFWRSAFSFRRNNTAPIKAKASEKLAVAPSASRGADAFTTSPIKKAAPTSIPTPTRERTESMGSTTSTRPGPELILLSPKDVHSLVKDIDSNSADFQQLVRTFFYQTASVENFLLKFQQAIRSLMEKESERAADRSINHTRVDSSNVKRAFADSTLPLAVDDSNTLTHVFEMTWALEGLYAFVLGVAEEWSNDVRCWLLAMLKECLKPPLLRPMHLKQLALCLKRMELLHSPLALATIQGCVDQLFSSTAVVTIENKKAPSLPLDGSSRDSSVLRSASTHTPGANALLAIRRTSAALSVLLEDLIPAFPTDVGLLNMYIERAARVIRYEVFDFFAGSKQSLSSIDVLTVVSFAEHQRQTIVSLGSDLPILQELEQESFTAFLQVATTSLRQAIARIQTADERSVAKEGHKQDGMPSGYMTSWPSEMMATYGEQLTLAARYLQPMTRELAWTTMLDTLPDFVSKQKVWISKAAAANAKNTCIDRICAHINNHLFFAESLDNKLDTLSADLDDSAAERITTHYHRITALFTAHADFALHLLMQQVISEIRTLLQNGLFRNGWENSVQIVHTAKKLLQAFKGSLFSWLRDAPFSSATLGAAAISICEVHVEMLLTVKPDITANTLERLQEDYQLWNEILRDYAVYLNNPMQMQIAQTPWKHLLTALSIDTRNMQPFVRNELYPSFGSATIKIWAIVMQMRDESKQVFDALFDTILCDWNPKPITPHFNSEAFVAKLKNPKQKMSFPSNSIFKFI